MTDTPNSPQGGSALAAKSASLLQNAKAKAQQAGNGITKVAAEIASSAVAEKADEAEKKAENLLLTKAVTFADSNRVAKEASTALSNLANGSVPDSNQVEASASSATGAASQGGRGQQDRQESSTANPGKKEAEGGGLGSKVKTAVGTLAADVKDKVVEKAGKIAGKGDKQAKLVELSSTAQALSDDSDSSAYHPGTTTAIRSAFTKMLGDKRTEKDTNNKESSGDAEDLSTTTSLSQFFTPNNH